MWEKINVEIICKTNRNIVVENKLPREKGGGGVNHEIGIDIYTLLLLLLLLLSRFSRVRLCVTHRWQPTGLPRPWDSPGKNTGVGCHFLLQCMKVKSESEVAQSCPTLRPHGLQPARLLRPWDFPGKSTGVACHCLLPYIHYYM